jgi:GT2 family glycosyltransferase
METGRGPARSRLPSVLAIVVTHNGREWLRDCLVSLSTQTYSALDVLVVDDASPDYRRPPQLKRVVKRHLRRRRWGFLRTPRPLGFGGAINWALGRARTNADLLLFVHDDAALEKEAVEKMVGRIMADASTGIVGPKIVSWEDPRQLEEVGMAVDRFGYPYKGLEEGEIDIGQHDTPSEVFFVTSTCMLVRSDLFRQLKGWDARMKAFSEDLDLCWRARVMGHAVRLEPEARARHAIALAKGERQSRFVPQRYFSRRNRLRSLIKNASALRLLFLLPLFVLLTIAEMVGFIILRQPGEILNLARALGWNVLRFPQTIAARTRVQKNRKVSDRRLGRLQIRETSRLRFYIQNQAGRLEEAWGRRTEIVARRGTQVRAMSRRMSGLPGLIALVTFIAFLLAFRNYLWSPPVSVGELLPYPDRATAMWREFFSPWRGVGLGQPGPGTPGFLALGIFPVITFGAMGFAQKLLMATLAIIAFIGAWRLVTPLVDPMGRLTAAIVYVTGGVGYTGIREGALGALVFAAAAPFALGSLMKLTGWTRPAAWDPGREIARLAAAAALSASFVPGSLFLYGVTAAVLAAGRAVVGSGPKELRSVIAPAVALIGSWALLLPWSSTWLDEGGPLNLLTSEESWRIHAARFADHGALSVLLGQTPEVPALMGLALPLFGLMAVFVGEGQRRRAAIALWSVVAVVALVVSLIAGGTIRPWFATPLEASVLAAAAWAGLAGIAVGAFRLDLPRRGLGLVQGLAVTAMAASVFLLVAGAAPAVWGGEWSPGAELEAQEPETIEEITQLLRAEADQSGTFRALWIGGGWTGTGRSAARPDEPVAVTGPSGQELSDLFERDIGEGEEVLDRIIASVEDKGTDTGGAFLGAFDIRYVVVEAGGDEAPWLRQRDLQIVQDAPTYLLLENQAPLAAAGVYDELPISVAAATAGDPVLSQDEAASPDQLADHVASSRYEADDVQGPGIAFVPQTNDEGWIAAIDDQDLGRADGGWGNAFDIPVEAEGDLTVAFRRGTEQIVLLVVVGIAWAIVLGACFSSSRRPTGRIG